MGSFVDMSFVIFMGVRTSPSGLHRGNFSSGIGIKQPFTAAPPYLGNSDGQLPVIVVVGFSGGFDVSDEFEEELDVELSGGPPVGGPPLGGPPVGGPPVGGP